MPAPGCAAPINSVGQRDENPAKSSLAVPRLFDVILKITRLDSPPGTMPPKRVKTPSKKPLVKEVGPPPSLMTRRGWLAIGASSGVILGFLVFLFRTSRRSFIGVVLGHKPVAGVRDEGFSYEENSEGKPFRMTTGHGKLWVPIDRRQTPTAMSVQLDNRRPPNQRSLPLKILVDGKSVFDGRVPTNPTVWETKIDLSEFEFRDQTQIELISDTFVPRRVMERGRNDDPRTLGVRVVGITLLRD